MDGANGAPSIPALYHAPMAAKIELSPGQQSALDRVGEWYKTPGQQILRLFGAAGTGKTTIARLVPEITGAKCHYGAYSGKAVSVLRAKGCLPARTLHSLLYAPPTDLRHELGRLEKLPDAPGRAERIQAVRTRIKTEGALSFRPSDDSPLDDTELIIVDEVSMVGDRMADDLLDHPAKVLVLGDPHQLPPVKGGGALTNAPADVVLTEIHRQALDSPVLSLATAIREGSCLNPQALAPRRRRWWEYDQILTWRRRTRWSAIRAIRSRSGAPADTPCSGDRIMCLVNNSDLGIYNGQTWTCTEVEPYDDGLVLLHLIDDDRCTVQIPTYLQGFTEAGEDSLERLGGTGDPHMIATFAQALTVHKAQGSEWDSVLIMDETPSMFAMEARRRGALDASDLTRKWLYTAVTRASQEVAIIAPRK